MTQYEIERDRDIILRRWKWERRFKNAAPWILSAVMVAALFWLARK